MYIVVYILNIKRQLATPTANQTNVFILYDQYIILDKHLKVWFSVYFYYFRGPFY